MEAMVSVVITGCSENLPDLVDETCFGKQPLLDIKEVVYRLGSVNPQGFQVGSDQTQLVK